MAVTIRGSGQVPVQIVTSQYTTEVSTTSTSFVDSGVSVTITPTNSANRILVLFQGQICIGTSGTTLMNIVRGSTNIAQPASGTNPSSFNIWANSNNFSWPTPFFWLDSPSTTSATTYKLQWRNDNGGTSYLGRHPTSANYNTPYSLTVMELAYA